MLHAYAYLTQLTHRKFLSLWGKDRATILHSSPLWFSASLRPPLQSLPLPTTPYIARKAPSNLNKQAIQTTKRWCGVMVARDVVVLFSSKEARISVSIWVRFPAPPYCEIYMMVWVHCVVSCVFFFFGIILVKGKGGGRRGEIRMWD